MDVELVAAFEAGRWRDEARQRGVGRRAAGIMPPSRAAACDPLALSTVFRGIQVLQTAITGLPIYETRAGLKLDSISSLVAQPDVNRSRRDFLADMVASMALDGNASCGWCVSAVKSCRVRCCRRLWLSFPTMEATPPPRNCDTATWARITAPRISSIASF